MSVIIFEPEDEDFLLLQEERVVVFCQGCDRVIEMSRYAETCPICGSEEVAPVERKKAA